MVISADRPQSQDAAGLVIFTSGTTGPPKGVVLRRSFVHDTAVAMIDLYDITHRDVVLHILPVHHVTGIGVTFFPFLYAAARIDFRSGSFEPAWIWERWRRGGLTFFSGVPTMYTRLMRFHDQRISALPQNQRSQYLQGLNNVRVMVCGSSALPQPVQDFWTSLRGGRMILTRYGATEFGLVFRVAALDSEEVPDGSVGVAAPGVDVKLSNKNDGEILISALDIEREIMGLPYVSEVMVVGVEDYEYGQRVGAILALHDDQETYAADGQRMLTLDELRRDLRPRLAGYKLPTLLRLWKGDLPKGSSGKVMKKELGSQLFPCHRWEKRSEVQIWKGTKMPLKAKI
ncbi:hypothetical protein PRZ48_012025 [Zasmidium cellare]|uniref:Uncharacterized protein n=1 Tax=Zasmidium cellare TaxID=395010 RepID=A0ABR0E827_ZASCE|nr:hypothetical protein PRZ48_012025 [Zasmidium cellare]